MPRQKPTVFLGSSSQAKPVAQALVTPLSEYALLKPWWAPENFKPSRSTLDGLLESARKYDFGIFILAPDDKTTSHSKTFFSARDNALFEFGLFLGALGDERAWAIAVTRSGRRAKPASDLLGITIPGIAYDDDNELGSIVQGIAVQFCEEMRKRGPRNFNLVGSWDFTKAEAEFSVMLDPGRMQRHADRIRERELLLVYRKEDLTLFRDNDIGIVMSQPRKVDVAKETNVEIRAAPSKGTESGLEIKVDDKFHGYLFILPKN